MQCCPDIPHEVALLVTEYLPLTTGLIEFTVSFPAAQHKDIIVHFVDPTALHPLYLSESAPRLFTRAFVSSTIQVVTIFTTLNCLLKTAYPGVFDKECNTPDLFQTAKPPALPLPDPDLNFGSACDSFMRLAQRIYGMLIVVTDADHCSEEWRSYLLSGLRANMPKRQFLFLNTGDVASGVAHEEFKTALESHIIGMALRDDHDNDLF